jgi:hypothetical protein
VNADQLAQLTNLVRAAAHPTLDPITNADHTAGERADWRPADVTVGGAWTFERPDGDGIEYQEVRLTTGGSIRHEFKLDLDAAGRLTVSSYVRIPAEHCDCDCDCSTLEPDRSDCPRHGGGVRELECQRIVENYTWRMQLHPVYHFPEWKFDLSLGAPTHDVLAAYIAEREAAKS